MSHRDNIAEAVSLLVEAGHEGLAVAEALRRVLHAEEVAEAAAPAHRRVVQQLHKVHLRMSGGVSGSVSG